MAKINQISTRIVRQRLLDVMRQRANNPRTRLEGRLRTQLGTQVAERLLQHLTWQNGRFEVSLYQGDGQVEANGRKYMYPGLKRSPIIISDQADIAHYQVTAKHPDIEGSKPQKLNYLEKYSLIPTRSGKLIFISDTHNHALFGWALAKEIGLTDKNAALVHVDAHLDESIPSYPGRTVKVRLSEQALEHITDRKHEYNYLYDKKAGTLSSRADAFDLEMMMLYHTDNMTERQAIKELYEHRKAWENGHPAKPESLEDFAVLSRRYADICSFISPADTRLFKDLFYVLTKENTLGTEQHRSDYNGMRQEGQIVSIELMLDRVRALKASGQKVILDLDLDYFAHYFQVEPDSGATAKDRISFEENFRQVVALAREADFITVATSPDWFSDQTGQAREILERFITAAR